MGNPSHSMPGGAAPNETVSGLNPSGYSIQSKPGVSVHLCLDLRTQGLGRMMRITLL